MTRKRDKSEVDYSKGLPHAHCGLCRHFEPPHACELVKGTIEPQMWCKLFAKRAVTKRSARYSG